MKFALSDLQVTSSTFADGGPIPRECTGEGADTSPDLQWKNVPDGTQSIAVICHDPDAPVISSGSYGFVHWVLYNLPASTTQLAGGATDFSSGINDFGNLGYGGPMPPEGHGTHRYFFWVIALSREPNLNDGLSLNQLLQEIEADALGMNRLVGTYQRD